MALLNESVEFKKLDIRMVERNMARGVLTHQEYLKFIEALPDDAANADWVDVENLSKSSEELEAGGKTVFSDH